MASLEEPTYDVFLVHCEADKLTAMYIDGLLSKAGMKCIASFNDELSRPGRYELESIKHDVENSRLTLVLLTKESKDSTWITLDTVLALEKSQRLKLLCIRLLLQGIEKSDKLKLKVGFLGNLPHFFIDVGSSDWEDRLVKSITEPCPISKILPAGNIAFGQVYSLVVGYYRYILPALKDGLTKSNYSFPGRTSLKFFILLPHDSKTYPKITDYEQRIRHVGKIDITEKVHVGKPREYKVDLYSIKDNSVEYYFVAEYPNVLNTMYQIQEQGIAAIDLRLQMARFYFTLMKVLNNTEHKDCNNTYNIIPYDAGASGETDNLCNLVLGKIKEELMAENIEKVLSPVTRILMAKEGSKRNDATITSCTDVVEDSEVAERMATITCCNEVVEDPKVAERIAAIVYCNEVEEDSEVAERIKSALEAHGWKYKDGTGDSIFNYIGSCKWKIFVLSKEGLYRKLLKAQFLAAVTDGIDENCLCVIPVLCGMKIQEVPDCIKWVTYLSSKEKDCEERLIQTMEGEEMTMETRLPSGDVATGLAWGFILNYLTIPLLGKCEDNTDLTDRIRKKLQEKSLSSACIKRLYITIPKTCQPTTIETNTEKYPNSDPLVENLGRLKTVKFTSSGTVNRPYELVMYRMTTKETKFPSGRTEICFLAEQATPSFTLFNMSLKYSNAGLSPEDLMEQGREFAELCTTHIASQMFKEKVADIEKLCKFVYFDNESKSVQDTLLEEIRKDLSSAVDLVF